MRDEIKKRVDAIEKQRAELHAMVDASLDAAILKECTTKPMAKVIDIGGRRRRMIRSTTHSTTRDTSIGVGVIGMAYRALASDPTTGLTSSSIQAAHIQAWLGEQMYGIYSDNMDELMTMVNIDMVTAAMKEYRRSAGAKA